MRCIQDMPFKIKNRVFHKITCLFRTPCHILYTIPMFFYMIIHTLYLLHRYILLYIERGLY